MAPLPAAGRARQSGERHAGLGRPGRPTVRASPSSSGVVGSQPSAFRASVMSGRRRVGSSAGSGRCTIGEDEPSSATTVRASSSTVYSSGLPMLTGPVRSESNSATQPAHLVVDVAEAPGLAPVAVDGERLAPHGLDEEVGDHPAVVGPQSRAVGVEDAGDADVGPAGPVVGHGERLGEPLGLVVDAAGPDRVDVAPSTPRSADAPRGRRRPRWSTPGGTGRRGGGRARARGGCPRCPTASVSSGRGPGSRGATPGWPGGTPRDTGPSTGIDRDTSASISVKPRMVVEVGQVGPPSGREVVDARRPRRRARGAGRRGGTRGIPPPPSTTTGRLTCDRSPRTRSRYRRSWAGSSRLRASTTTGLAHLRPHGVEVEPAELVPLGEHHDGGGILAGRVGVGGDAAPSPGEPARSAPTSSSIGRASSSSGTKRSGRRPARRRRRRPGAGRSRRPASCAGRRCPP